MGTISRVYSSRWLAIKMWDVWYPLRIDTWSHTYLWYLRCGNGTDICSVPFDHFWTVSCRWTLLVTIQKLHRKCWLWRSTEEPMVDLCKLKMEEDRVHMIVLYHRHTCNPSLWILGDAFLQQSQAIRFLRIEIHKGLPMDLQWSSTGNWSRAQQ